MPGTGKLILLEARHSSAYTLLGDRDPLVCQNEGFVIRTFLSDVDHTAAIWVEHQLLDPAAAWVQN